MNPKIFVFVAVLALGAILGGKFKAEYLRGVLAIIVLAVCIKIFLDLTLTPNYLFSIN